MWVCAGGKGETMNLIGVVLMESSFVYCSSTAVEQVLHMKGISENYYNQLLF